MYPGPNHCIYSHYYDSHSMLKESHWNIQDMHVNRVQASVRSLYWAESKNETSPFKKQNVCYVYLFQIFTWKV